MPKVETPSPEPNMGAWKLEDWKIIGRTIDNEILHFEYRHKLTLRQRVPQNAWIEMGVLLNAAPDNCQVTFLKMDRTPNEKNELKKEYSLEAIVASSLFKGEDVNA